VVILPDPVGPVDTDGTLGGDISIDYTEGGTNANLTFLGCVNVNPPFAGDFTPTVDTGISVTGVGAIAFAAVCIQTPCLLSTCSFHNTLNAVNLQLTTFYSLGEGISNLPPANFPNGFGTAKIYNTPEPGALAMLGLGFGGLILGRNRKS
jgi:hypothetical protein